MVNRCAAPKRKTGKDSKDNQSKKVATFHFLF